MAESSRDRLLKQFRELVGERVGKITRSLMELESGPSPDEGKNALRELHGLKGEARMMGFADVNRLVHEMEDLVRSAEPIGYALTGGSTDALLAAADAVLNLAGVAESGAPPEVDKLVGWLKQRTGAEQELHGPKKATGRGEPTREATATQSQAEALARAAQVEPGVSASVQAEPGRGASDPAPVADPAVPRRTTDKQLDGALRISLQSLELLTTAATNLSQISRRRGLVATRRLAFARELAQIARAAEELGPAGQEIAAQLTRAKETAAQLHREEKLLANEELKDLSQLSEEVHSLRMLPLSVLFEPYPRMVRDLSRELDKEVELQIRGEDTRADRAVVEAMRDPLIHLVRNALDHGLETREARSRAGKPVKGRLHLFAEREGDRILIRVEDDGAGIDPEKMRKVAVRKGLMDEASANALSDAAARDLIFLPGFTSKEAASDLSGRGVGLDAVRTRMQGLGGDVVLHSGIGRGSLFELRIPVSLTVAPLLFVQVGDQKLSLTAAHVTHAVKIEREQIRELAGRPAIRANDEVLPFAAIDSILGLEPERPPHEGELALLVRAQGTTAAISVDRVLEERTQPILPLKGMLGRYPHLTGATMLADGSLAMVLSAGHLIAAAHGTSRMRMSVASTAREERRKRILLADDSPLTRELLASLLEAMGYEILTASDGQEAYEKLGRESVDMIVTDLEMPRMDGLELTRKVKAHPTWRALPVVIVTTRGGDADRQRGMEAGADGYIAKGDLVRQDLVDVVSRLMG